MDSGTYSYLAFSDDENQVLSQVHKGSSLGDALRQYWVPALLSDALTEAGGPPVRVKILGEALVAFRTRDNEVGLLKEACPHRGASLFRGRNDGHALQCVYHGWSFDVYGKNVECPTNRA